MSFKYSVVRCGLLGTLSVLYASGLNDTKPKQRQLNIIISFDPKWLTYAVALVDSPCDLTLTIRGRRAMRKK